MCLSKGLAAPMGSMLVGDRETIARARRWRKMVGGGLRQAGLVAAAGLYALQNNVDRLREDHDKAARVAGALASFPQFALDGEPQTNMVFLDPAMETEGLRQHLERHGITITGHRWVFHRDISDTDVDTLLDACRRFGGGSG